MKYPLSTIYSNQIESIPFFHFHPGQRVLTIGTSGCNLDCKYCMNQHLLNEPVHSFDLSPEAVALKAKSAGCKLISFSANEPAVSFEYFLEIAAAAAELGIMTGCSSNGLFSEIQLERVSQAISFVNISIKGPDEQFYREVCGGGHPDRVFRTIEALHSAGVHVEVTTPYMPSISASGMMSMAERIGALDRAIPWHIFRLLAEYKLEGQSQTAIEDMLQLRESAAAHLDHIYLENFAGSLWLDTHCSSCGQVLIKRFSTGGCGAYYYESYLKQGCCPVCGKSFDLLASDSDQAQIVPDPRQAYIDAVNWQAGFDMFSGLSVEGAPQEDVKPYPGDLQLAAERWVTESALPLITKRDPELAVLVYSQPCFAGRHKAELYDEMVAGVKGEIEGFLDRTAYDYLVVGLGDLVPNRGVINLERVISGVASCEEGIGALYACTAADAARVAGLDGVARVYTKAELSSLTGCALDELGDYFVLPEEGYQLLGLSSSSNRLTKFVSGMNKQLPSWSSIGNPGTIHGIRKTVAGAVAKGRKVALIIIDGVGCDNFPFDYAPIDNMFGDIPYVSSQHQYMVISSGQQIYPRFFAYPHWRNNSHKNPFSRNCSFLDDSLISDVAALGASSISVGNRSIMTQMAFPADLSIECRCMGLHNYGTLEVHR